MVCLDVMEHIEPGNGVNGRRYVENVLEDIRQCLNPKGPRKALIGISTQEAIATLPDGRNAHLTVEPWGWWWEELQQAGFTVIGPEGDFTPDEISRAKEMGVHIARLGRLVLRSETASVVTVAILQHVLGAL